MRSVVIHLPSRPIWRATVAWAFPLLRAAVFLATSRVIGADCGGDRPACIARQGDLTAEDRRIANHLLVARGRATLSVRP